MLTDTTLQELCKNIRKDILVSTFHAKSGHPTSSLSAVELLTVLFFRYLVFETENYPQIYHDEFILSKGHAAPLLYSIYKRAGIINEDLLSLRKIGSPLEGHPSTKLKGVKYATGSLGQGLPIAVGAAIARKKMNVDSRVYVLCGDGEFAEGSNYEALNIASHYKLNNLCLIIDVNKYGQSSKTLFDHRVDEYVKRLESFGWEAISIDGHDIDQISSAYQRFLNRNSSNPFAIVAKTYKGKGVSFLEDKESWHGKPIQKEEDLKKAIEELNIQEENVKVNIRNSRYDFSNNVSNSVSLISIDIDDDVLPTRQSIAKALTKIGKYINSLIVLDADVKNSTFTEYFEREYPDRFVQCFIAEQAMVGMALGLAKNGFLVYLSTFGAFLSRAFDFIRMMNYSNVPLVVMVGTHAGVSIGEDGPSQMALEDIAFMKSIIDTTVLYPSDSISAQKLLVEVFNQHLRGNLRGIVYFRASRGAIDNIYSKDDNFEIGKVKVVKQSSDDKVVVLSNGVPLYEVIKAHQMLKNENINIRVIDVYSIKPIIEEDFIEKLGNIRKILVVEEHSRWGGTFETVSSIILKNKYNVEYFDVFSVDKIPLSGTPMSLLNYHSLDSESIYRKIKEII